jgi:hypothetical protein
LLSTALQQLCVHYLPNTVALKDSASWKSIILQTLKVEKEVKVKDTVVQVLGPHLAGLENISRRFINNLVWDLILVCIDAPGNWL